jgi:hypothetical protein
VPVCMAMRVCAVVAVRVVRVVRGVVVACAHCRDSA